MVTNTFCPSCRAMIGSDWFFCLTHWRMLPVGLQNQIRRADKARGKLIKDACSYINQWEKRYINRRMIG